ncbi:MAG: family 43 glycosylhydrolase [Clostridia bacterium]|nr:family 43 glycosylhydrolase [Clostridia bacterium]
MWLHHDEGIFYLFYSGGFYGDSSYSLGYATSASPLGPFEKYEGNPILFSTNMVSGPGNNSFFLYRGRQGAVQRLPYPYRGGDRGRQPQAGYLPARMEGRRHCLYERSHLYHAARSFR